MKFVKTALILMILVACNLALMAAYNLGGQEDFAYLSHARAQINDGARIVLVSSAADSGPGTLRQALADAQEGDIITFPEDFAGRTIALASPLYVQQNGVTLTGLTTADGQPNVILKGGFTNQLALLKVFASDFTMTGFRFTCMMRDGIHIQAGRELWLRQPPQAIRNIRIENNVFDNTDIEVPISEIIRVMMAPQAMSTDATIENVKILRNTFLRNRGGAGITVQANGGTNCLIKDVVIEGNSFVGMMTSIDVSTANGSNNRVVGTRIIRNRHQDNLQNAIFVYHLEDPGPSSKNLIDDTIIFGNVFSGEGDSPGFLTIIGGGNNTYGNLISNTQIVNNLIIKGYGISIAGSQSGSAGNRIEGVRIVNNTMDIDRYCLMVESDPEHTAKGNSISGVEVWNTIFRNWEWGSFRGEVTPDQVHSCITSQAGFAGINGNISADPMFVDPQLGDYHLRPGSPAIDAGFDSGAPMTDLEGKPRPMDGNDDGIAVCDIGAFEAGTQFHTLNLTSTSGGTTDPPPGIFFFKKETGQTVSATPDIFHRFTRWTGDVPTGHEKDNPIVLSMETDKVIKANFTKIITNISLSRTTLNFGTTGGSSSTQAQSIIISNTGTGLLNWTAECSANPYFLQVTPTHGTGNSVIQIGVNTAGLIPGTYTNIVNISDPNATNSPQIITVKIRVYNAGSTSPPLGSFDTPIEGTTGVTGAIPVTGWAIDDIEVAKVEIWRDAFSGETSGLWFIGDAIFVEGARPDVETAYPDYPFNYRAGWGYMLLTNMLPNKGNGTYKFYAYATDKEGNRALLGTKTITCSNATAVKPFGTIDTPAQGGDVSGNAYVNFGWVLTPQPSLIPKDGSTITAWVDGVQVGVLKDSPNAYNQYRADIAGLFPGLKNSDGSVGFAYLNTTLYSNGVHTIYWIATDDAGHADGIGSRYFNIINTGSPSLQSNRANQAIDLNHSYSYDSAMNLPVSFEPRRVKRGFDLNAKPDSIQPDEYGVVHLNLREVERLELDLGPLLGDIGAVFGAFEYTGFLVVGNELRPLPIGSTLDQRKGTFSWLPGPGFLGEYQFLFMRKDQVGVQTRINVNIRIIPKFGLK